MSVLGLLLAICAGLLVGLAWAWQLHRARLAGAPYLWAWPLAAVLLFGGALGASVGGVLEVWQFAGALALILSAVMAAGLLAFRSRVSRGGAVDASSLEAERKLTDDTITMMAAAIAVLVALPMVDEPTARLVAAGGLLAAAVPACHAIYLALTRRR